MAVNKEIWRPDIIEALFASNKFMSRAFNADEYVVGARIVHIPQSGGPAAVQVNRSVLPGVILKRNDTDVIYSLDELTSDPTLVTDIDKKELSFDKRASVIRENTENLMQLAGTLMLYKWAQNVPSVNTVTTTGTVNITAGAKVVLEADILAAQLILNKQNVPDEGRVLVLTSEHESQLRQDAQLKYAFQAQNIVDVKDGSIGRLHGFDIYRRSTVLTVDSTGALKAPGTASISTDKNCSLFYHEMFVERAFGNVEIFDNPDRAEYYGDIISFLARIGGRNRRSDFKGVGIIIPG